MNGLPIGVYSGLLGLSAVVALVSGIYTILRLRSLARVAERAGTEVVAGPKLRPPAPRRRVLWSAVICGIASVVALALLTLIATGAIGSGQTRNDPTVQRP